MEYLISSDIGTTALKSSIVGKDGTILASSSAEYPLFADGPVMEQDPEHWWEAFCTTVRSLLETNPGIEVSAIVLSGQMQDIIRIENRIPAGRAILYSDTRAQKELLELVDTFGMERLQQITMNTPDASSIPPKLLMLKHMGFITERTRFLLGAHDYVCWKLTGMFVTDPTNASTMGMLNFRKNEWDTEILSFLGISSTQLPEIEPAGTISGTVNAAAARQCGLKAGVTVIHGAGDAGSSTVGAGAGIPGVYSCYLGTSGWIATTLPDPIMPSYGMFNLKHPNGIDTITIGAMRTTGGNISWVLEAFGEQQDKYTVLQKTASTASPGSSGVIYLPYLQGERSPFQDPDARGAFIGLSRDTGKPELYRAVLEGVCFGLALILDRLKAGTGNHSGAMIASGGGAENRLFTEILASVTGIPVQVPSNASSNGVLGNAVIAGCALGWHEGYALPKEYEEGCRSIVPDTAAQELYQEYRKVFNRLYPALQDEFHHIASLNLKQ